MLDKNIIITGATDGIGLQAAKVIANKGYRVGLVGRNKEKGYQAKEIIVNSTSNDKIDFFECDLSLIKNVKNKRKIINQC